MYLTCFKDSLPILSDSYQVIFASKLSYGCWHKRGPVLFKSLYHPNYTISLPLMESLFVKKEAGRCQKKRH